MKFSYLSIINRFCNITRPSLQDLDGVMNECLTSDYKTNIGYWESNKGICVKSCINMRLCKNSKLGRVLKC